MREGEREEIEEGRRERGGREEGRRRERGGKEKGEGGKEDPIISPGNKKPLAGSPEVRVRWG